MKWLSFCYVMNSLMIKCEVKMTGYSFSIVPFFMEQDLVLLHYVSSKPTLSLFHTCLVDICKQKLGADEEKAKAYVKKLQDSHRYVQELWSS